MPESKTHLYKRALSARRAYCRTLDHIARDDIRTAPLIVECAAHSLELIETNPEMGTLLQAGRARRYPVPRAGHAFHYQVSAESIKIVHWYRLRRRIIL